MNNMVQNKRPESSIYTLNELYNSGKVYLMDNHMAAAWCWAQKINFADGYNLFHIDKHYDLLNGSTDFLVTQLLENNFNLQKVNIEEYISAKHKPTISNSNTQIFRFDNYMTIFKKLYPEILKKIKFATHKDGTIPEDWDFYEAEIYDLPTNLSYWIKETNEKWIVNIDIDYFFDNHPIDGYFQFLTDEYIQLLADQLLESWDKIEIITIALSPTFCKDMAHSKRIAKLICDKLNIVFD